MGAQSPLRDLREDIVDIVSSLCARGSLPLWYHENHLISSILLQNYLTAIPRPALRPIPRWNCPAPGNFILTPKCIGNGAGNSLESTATDTGSIVLNDSAQLLMMLTDKPEFNTDNRIVRTIDRLPGAWNQGNRQNCPARNQTR